MNSEFLKGYLDFIVLSSMKYNDMYGYEITKHINATSNNLFNLKESTIYLILKRLEKKQLLESYWSNEENQSQKRKYYKLTKEGNTYIDFQKEEIKAFSEYLKSLF